MAARNTADSKRFVLRAANNEVEPYYVPITSSSSIVSEPKVLPSMITRSTDSLTTQVENEAPVRRVVLIRNSKNAQVNQGPVDLDELKRSNSLNNSPRITDGNKSIFLIRRPIGQSEPSKPTETQSSFHDPPYTTSLEYIRTPSPPPTISQVVSSTDRSRSLIGRRKTSKLPENSERSVTYIPRSTSRIRTVSPNHINSARQSPSPDRIRSRPPKQDESPEIVEREPSFSYYSLKNTGEPVSSPLAAIIEDEQQIAQHRPKSTERSARRKRSAKSVLLVPPVSDNQSNTTVENYVIREEPLKPIIKRPKSIKRTRFEDDMNDGSRDASVKANRWETCLRHLSKYMCLVLLICFFLILIGLAGVGVSAYFLVTNSSNNFVPTVVGIAVGAFLAITALCFLCILLICIGSHEDYFTYNVDGPRIGGRVFATIPPTHPNAHLYIPRDYMKLIENGYPVARVSTSKGSRKKSSSIFHRSKTSSNSKKNITIEMPEGLLTGGPKSAKEREANLNKMVKNIGQIVEDTKKRYHGDLPDKVIVKVDNNLTQTT